MSYAGPTAAMYLADLGATVVKVERPGSGGGRTLLGSSVGRWGVCMVRLGQPQQALIGAQSPLDRGRETLMRVLDHADVFLRNMNPSKLVRLGIDHTSLRECNPRLVYCAMSGFGLDGPRQRAAWLRPRGASAIRTDVGHR